MNQVISTFFDIFRTNAKSEEFYPHLNQFETERQKTLLQAVQIGSTLCIFLVPLFGILDLFVKNHVLAQFIIIRTMITLSAFIIIILAMTKIGAKYPYFLGAFLTFVAGGGIALMCHMDQGPIDLYYAGINLPLLGFGILSPLYLKEALIVFISVWLIYVIPNLHLLNPENLGIFISNNFFLITSMLLACVSSQFHLYYFRNTWFARFRLEEANVKIKNHSRDLENLVHERTQKLLQSERLAVVGQLVGGIAHDFNNFLTAILGTSDLILRQKTPRKNMLRDIESIYHAGIRASALVKQLLAFSRQQTYDPQLLNVNQVVQQTKKLLQRIIGEDIQLLFYQQENMNLIMADPIQLEQIILNLAVNARDAMPHGGQLLIETSQVDLTQEYCDSRFTKIKPGSYIMLAISDTGEGMTEEVKSKIFEPFFTTKQLGKGTGLGLSSVYGIVEQMKGIIHVYSEIGVGSMFKIYLPCASKTQTRKVKIKAPKIIPGGKETILLVEDEDDVRELTARLLKEQGYKVFEAKAADEAIAFVRKTKDKIDLLLTDVVMPRMNGKELADKLGSMIMDLKVLYMSGYTNLFMANHGYISRGTSFLQKPFTLETLSTKVRNTFDN
jgi:signal transduction histidine kinase/CheY-like chemotaxis protein